MSYTIKANIRDVCSLCTYHEDENSDRADAESHMVEVAKYTDSNGEHKTMGIFKLTSDSYRDSAMLDWILARKSDETEETYGDFNDLMNVKFA